ncbi:MAG: PA0069 family radical SAM protein [Steroidobacteraceae bacterium]
MARLLKGRGAVSNPPPRFDPHHSEAVDDGWYTEPLPDSVATRVQPEPARTVITRNDSPDIGFSQSINPYRGCEHGCVFCYARPSHAYLGLSPGLDFETKLFYKAQAAERLTAELSKPRYVPKTIMLGANTDPYQPLEKRLKVTRSILEVLAKCRHPVSIVTKGALIERDLDILATMAEQNLSSVMVSLTTLDADLKRRLEPRAASPLARLATIRRLHAAGVPVGTLIAPVIPALTDHELERLLEAAADAGARCAGYVVLRLPHELKDLFRDWLATHYPERAQHVMSRIQSIRNGRDNDPAFGSRMRGSGVDAALLARRFEVATRRLGLETRWGFTLDTSRFQPPKAASPQLTLAF